MKCDRSVHKAMIFPVEIYQINKVFSFKPKNSYKLGFSYQLCRMLLDQPQSDIAVFVIINFRIYYIVVKKMEKWNSS